MRVTFLHACRSAHEITMSSPLPPLPLEETAPSIREPSMPRLPNSFTKIAHRSSLCRDWILCSINQDIRVVFPDPRLPVMIFTGMGSFIFQQDNPYVRLRSLKNDDVQWTMDVECQTLKVCHQPEFDRIMHTSSSFIDQGETYNGGARFSLRAGYFGVEASGTDCRAGRTALC